MEEAVKTFLSPPQVSDFCYGDIQDGHSITARVWLGFDEYKRVIYSISHRLTSKERLLKGADFMMESIFGFYVKSVKYLEYMFPVSPVHESCALSEDGKNIGILHCHDYITIPGEKLFYLFSIDNNTTEIYRVQFPFCVTVCNTFQLFHSSYIGWFCRTETFESSDLYQIDIDEDAKILHVTFMVHIPPVKFDICLRPILFDKSLIFFSHSRHVTYCIDLVEKTCQEKYGYYNKSFSYVPFCSKDGLRIFAIKEGREYIDGKWITGFVYQLNDWRWERKSYTFDKIGLPITAGFCLDSFIFAASKCESQYIATEVVRLKDLVMECLLNTCHRMGLNRKQAADRLNLPLSLKRIYFGPVWTWD